MYRHSALYNLVLFLHVASAAVAFAPALAHPLGARRLRGEAAHRRFHAAAAANNSRVYFPALVLAGSLGIVLVVLADEALISFAHAWVSLSLLAWIALCGVVSGVVLPNERKVAEGDAAAERKVDFGGTAAVALFLAILFLMVFKPGSPLT